MMADSTVDSLAAPKAGNWVLLKAVESGCLKVACLVEKKAVWKVG
jgi:hypothetical protein